MERDGADAAFPELPDSFVENSDCSLWTTGASTVEEADLTNSPISLSLLRTVLLLTPNCFANS